MSVIAVVIVERVTEFCGGTGNYSANLETVALAPIKGPLCGADLVEQSGVNTLATHQKYCIPVQGMTRKNDQGNGDM